MALIVKPDLSSIWASSGAKSAPTPTKIAAGWGYEMMPFEWENYIQNRTDMALNHFNQRGIAEWDSTTEYRADRSYCTGSDGIVYRAVTTNTNINPTSDSGTNWVRAFLNGTGNVGIGGVPVAKLDIFNTGGRLQSWSAVSTTGNRLLSVNTANSAAAPLEISGSDIRFTNGSNAVVGIFDTSGKLGIGSTTPGEPLHIQVGANDTSIRLQNTTASTKVWNLTAGGGGNYGAGTFAIRNVTGGTTPLFIDSAERVVISSGPTGFTTSATKGIQQWFDTVNNIGYIYSGQSGVGNYALNIGPTAYSLHIAGSGAIGLGTYSPSPNSTLSVNGVNFSIAHGATGNGSYFESSSNSSAGGFLWANHYYNAGDKASVNGYAPLINLNLADGSIRFSTSAVAVADAFLSMTERMRIDANGNVGIGTSTPPSKLSVGGAVQSTADALAVGLYTAGALRFTQSSDTYIDGSTGGTTGNLIIRTGSSVVERMRIDASGNVLVGTTSPNYSAPGRGLIEVNGSTDAVIALNRAGNGKGYLQAVSDNGMVLANISTTGYMAFNTNASERLRIDASGSVTVNSASPVGTNGISTQSAGMTANGFSAVVTGSAAMFVGMNNSGATVRGVTTGTVGLGTADGVPITFGVSNSEKLRIAVNGDIGSLTSPAFGVGFHLYRPAGADATIRLQQNDVSGKTFDLVSSSTGSELGVGKFAIYDVGASAARLLIDSAGNITSPGSASAIGYSTGAGGTVVQATNKSTAVTINNPTGKITTHVQSMPYNSIFKFTVNNSVVKAGDVVVINLVGGAANPEFYDVAVVSTTAGSFKVVLYNRWTGTALAEELQLQFAVIRGVTA